MLRAYRVWGLGLRVLNQTRVNARVSDLNYMWGFPKIGGIPLFLEGGGGGGSISGDSIPFGVVKGCPYFGKYTCGRWCLASIGVPGTVSNAIMEAESALNPKA